MTIRLVSDQSESDVRKHEDEEALKSALRALTANLLRICRGGGKAELGRQLTGCIRAFQDYYESHGHYPVHATIQQILDPDAAMKEHRPWIDQNEDDLARWADDGTLERERAFQQIRNGALQVDASMLLNQITQERRGETEMADGIRALEAANEKYRQSHVRTTAKRERPKS